MKQTRNHNLEMKDLTIGYKGHIVLSAINGFVNSGSLISLIGANGAGKSTLLKVLSGEMKALRGKVLIDSKSITDYSRSELSRLVSIVATDFDVNVGGLKVCELVSLGRQPYTGFFGVMAQRDKDIVDDALCRVGIAHKASSFFGNLSDGERQKALIARALAQETPIILLDEPFSFLDPAAKIEIFTTMCREVEKNDKIIILSTHDVALALRMSDRMWMINEGSLVSLTTEEAVQSGVLSSVYKSSLSHFSPEIRDFVSNIRN